MASLLDAVTQWLLTYGVERTYWLAYSGGLDSHVLLHLFARLRAVYPVQLRAVHINHGVSANAANWTLHCEKICRELQVDFFPHKLNFPAAQTEFSSPEDFLRQYRYQYFATLLKPNDMLLTAHHQNDQAETVLLQLFRGAGPKGLAAMPQIKSLAQGFHGRPLLNFTREELKNYAEQQQLQWIDDESNADVNFTRNFLRHEVLPILAKRWPTIANTLARTAEHCAEAQQLLDNIAQQDLLNSVRPEEHPSDNKTLSVKKLLSLDSLRQSQVIRLWLSQNNFPLPSAVKMQQILQRVLLARDDKMPCVKWRGVEIRRYRDDLFALTPLAPHDATQMLQWNLQTPLVLPNNGILQADKMIGQGLRADIQNVTVRFRQGGEKFQLPGRQCHHDLKKLMQTWGVLPWERDRVPLIYVQDVLAAVVGFFVADEFVARGDEEGIWVGLSSYPEK